MNLNHSQKGNISDYFAFDANALDLIHIDPSVAFAVFHHPKLLLPVFIDAVVEAQTEVLRNQRDTTRKFLLKRKVTVRIHSLPSIYRFCRSSIGQIRSLSDASALLQVCGTVVRTGSVRLLERSKTYQCMKQKCQHKFTVYADPEQGNILLTPRACPRRLETSIHHQQDVAARHDRSITGTCGSTQIHEIENERSDC